MSASPRRRARSSAWPASWDPAAPSLPRRCSACGPPTPARSTFAALVDVVSIACRCGSRGARLRAGGPAPPRRPRRSQRGREHQPRLARSRLGVGFPAAAGGARPRGPVHPPVPHPHAVAGHRGRVAVRRESAEGRARAMAGDRAVHPDPRRADAGRRRRRQGGDSCAHARARRRRAGDRDDLLGPAGNPRHERSRARHAAGPLARRARARPTPAQKPSWRWPWSATRPVDGRAPCTRCRPTAVEAALGLVILALAAVLAVGGAQVLRAVEPRRPGPREPAGAHCRDRRDARRS